MESITIITDAHIDEKPSPRDRLDITQIEINVIANDSANIEYLGNEGEASRRNEESVSKFLWEQLVLGLT